MTDERTPMDIAASELLRIVTEKEAEGLTWRHLRDATFRARKQYKARGE